MSNTPDLQFSSVKYSVAQIQALTGAYAVVNFVFTVYSPGPGQALGLIAYAQVRDSSGNLQYLSVPDILQVDTSIAAFEPAGPVILTNNYIAATQVASFIEGATTGSYLLFTPGLFTGTEYLYYDIELLSGVGGHDGDETLYINTNPSPPAPAPF